MFSKTIQRAGYSIHNSILALIPDNGSYDSLRHNVQAEKKEQIICHQSLY